MWVSGRKYHRNATSAWVESNCHQFSGVFIDDPLKWCPGRLGDTAPARSGPSLYGERSSVAKHPRSSGRLAEP